MDIAKDLTRAERTVAGWLHPDNTKEGTMTETTTTQAGAPEVPFWSAVHQNLAVFASRVETFIPKLEQVATTPMLDDLIEAGLLATGQGGAEAVVAGVIGILKAHGSGGENTVDAVIELLKAVTHKTPGPQAGEPLRAAATAGAGHPQVI